MHTDYSVFFVVVFIVENCIHNFLSFRAEILLHRVCSDDLHCAEMK